MNNENKPYLQYKEFLKLKKEKPLYRIPIDLGFTCPNRDEDGTGGCSFCSENGARAVQTLETYSVNDQIRKAIFFSKERYNAENFIAYIQAYTAEFNKTSQEKYLRILKEFNFEAVSFGTRPDSINDESLEFMKQLKKKGIEVFVDLGVQTVHDKTLLKINRKHDWKESYRAITDLAKNEINTIIHLIIGLPGENIEDYIETAKTISKLPIHAIKFHNLHLLKNTIMYDEYQIKNFPLLNEYEYGEILMEMLKYIPADIPIVRITTDSLGDELVFPRWEMSKGEFISYIEKQMIFREWQQGSLFNIQYLISNVQYSSDVKEFDLMYKKKFFLSEEGVRNSESFFINPVRFLFERYGGEELQILDIGFGVGYNSYNSLLTSNQNLNIVALEIDRKILRLGSESEIFETKKTENNLEWGDILLNLYNEGFYNSKDKNNHHIKLLLGDARYSITKLEKERFDVVFLDPFLPRFNSELWTVEFFSRIKNVMKREKSVLVFKHGKLLILKGILLSGLNVYRIEKEKNKFQYLASRMRFEEMKQFLSLSGKAINQLNIEDLAKISKRRNKELLIPYSDPFQVWSNKKIHENREKFF